MLSITNLTVIYPDKTKAVDRVSLTLQAGENIALLGENGAGKTSLLYALVGILETAEGKIEIDGITLTLKTVNDVRQRVGVVFQNPDDQLFMPLVYDDIAFGCRSLGMTEAAIKTRVEETLDQLNIRRLQHRSSLKLSGGEKRMAAIATVLSMRPSVLIFDEPTAFLDPKARRRLIEALLRLRHPKIIATHDMSFAAEVCDRVIVLKNGCVAADGTMDLLYDRAVMEDCGLEALTATGAACIPPNGE